VREWLARFFDWTRRDRLDAELKQELQFHRQQLERDARHAGEAVEEAQTLAHRRLGNGTRIVEESRERWSVPWLDHLQQDIRYTLRGLRRSPGFTSSVIATLGLGIGANVAMFGVIDQLMFRPPAYLRDPGTVHRVYLQSLNRDAGITGKIRRTTDGLEYTRYVDLTQWTRSFSQTAAYYTTSMAVGTGTAAREREVAAVTASYFKFFDARPTLGRYFVDSEDRTPIGAAVAVLDFGFWQSEFGGHDVIGQALQVGSISATIVGVAPEKFSGFAESGPAAVYVPVTTFAGMDRGEDGKTYFTTYAWSWLRMVARRKPDVSTDAATADLTSAYRRSWNAEREMQTRLPSPEQAGARAILGSERAAAGPNPSLENRTLVWVTGVAAIVLLIACANVANLFLARTLRRRKEVALRVALGVSRNRLVTQSLTESVILSLLGGVAGVALAQWGGIALRRLFVETTSRLDLITDLRTLAFAFAAALLTGVLTGGAPVLFSLGRDLAPTLKLGPRQGAYDRSALRTGLLVMQGALSMVLLVGAGLFVRSLSNVRDLRIGYDSDRVLVVFRNLRGAELTDSANVQLGRELLSTAQAIPDVESAAWVSSVPFYTTSSTALFVPGIDSVRRLGAFSYQQGTTDYFKTIGTRIIRGRGFTADDRATSPRVAVVSESMAKVLWPNADAIGQCMHVGRDTMPCTTVVGVAEDVMHDDLVEKQHYRYYLPIEQFRPLNGYAVLLRMRGDPTKASDRVRQTLQAAMPGETYVNVRAFSDMVETERRSWQVGATMFVALGALALVVAAVGLYGVIAYNVAQRMHELGVRVALGAQASNVVRLVVGQGLRFAVFGVVIGAVVALVAARWLQPLLYNQSATDVRVFGLVGGVLLGVALMATSIPARRATKVDPISVLRSE
jgi:predicted permease